MYNFQDGSLYSGVFFFVKDNSNMTSIRTIIRDIKVYIALKCIEQTRIKIYGFPCHCNTSILFSKILNLGFEAWKYRNIDG